VPTRANNPGDLGPDDCGHQYPVLHAVGSDVSVLPNVQMGWQCLHDKIAKAFTGRSAVYSTSMTFAEFGRKYAGTDRNGTNENPGPWAVNVASDLGVTAATRIDDWIQAG